MTVVEEKGDVILTDKLMTSDEKQVKVEETVDDAQNEWSSKDGAGLNATDDTKKLGICS